MNAIIILFIVGSLLLAAEIFLPGAVAGILGGVALLVGSVLSFQQFGFAGGLAAIGSAAMLVGIMLYLELVVLPRTALGRKMVVEATVDATSQPPVAELEAVINRPAEALTPLAPSGYVSVDGRRFEAASRSGFIAKGTALRVVGVDNFRLIVTTT
ncbi:MAG: serine protease [Opitutaceae bacterium]|nr:serine protease [Opitutaceae bacterium]